MSATELLEPILKGGIRSVNFFNGRLLSAEDLSDEQSANRLGRGLLGQALGEGVAYGLEVTRAAPPSAAPAAAPAAPPSGVVTVAAGLAVNRRGQALRLPAQTDLSLVRQAGAGATAAAGFRDCQQLQGSVAASGEGVYLLTVAPAEGREGRAPASGLGGVNASCVARYAVEGVSFRLVQLPVQLPSPTEPGAGLTLRNRVAYQCFGVETLKKFEGTPFGQAPRRYGLIDGLRPNVLTDCEVPLATIYWKNGIDFIDLWSARRRISGASSASERWGALLDDRRAAEAEAMLLQFQDHVASLAGSKAETDFEYLPSVGLLPVGTKGFDWRTFLGPHAPAEATSLDEGLLRSVIRRALLLGPVKVFAGAATSKQGPPAPLAVYQVGSSSDFVLFARSPRGRIRVILGAANAGAPPRDIYAESERTDTRHFAGAGGAEGIYPISELEAGVYSVTLTSTSFEGKTENVVVVAGQTTDLSFTSGPPGSITVTVLNKATKQPVGSAVQSVTAAPTQGGGTPTQGTPAQGGQWNISNLAAGSYKVTAAATGFVTGTAADVAVASGQSTNVTIELDPVVTNGVIGLEVSDQLFGARADAAVLSARATNAQTGAVTQGAKGGNGLWAISNLPAGTYNVEVTATNYQTKTVSGVTLTAGQTKTVQVTMQPTPGSIALTINDRVTNAAISDKVTAVTAIGSLGVFNGVRGADGRWTVSGLPPGTYSVAVTATGYQNETTPNVSVQAAQAKTLAVTMQPVQAAPGAILLTATDDATNAPIDSQVTGVTAASGQLTFPGTKGADGRWSVANLPPGTYSVTVAATNYQGKTVPGVEVVSNQVKSLPVAMQAVPGSVKLTVTDANTNAVIDNQVTGVTATRGTGTFHGTKGSDGKWVIANLAPGTYSVTAAAPNYNPGTPVSVQVTSNAQATPTVPLPPRPGTVVLSIRRMVLLDRPFTDNFSATVTPGNQTAAFSNDQCTINGVPAGAVSVMVRNTSRGGYPDTVFQLQVPPNGQVTQGQIPLAPLSVFVKDTNGGNIAPGGGDTAVAAASVSAGGASLDDDDGGGGGGGGPLITTTDTTTVDPFLVESPPVSPWNTHATISADNDNTLVQLLLEFWRDWLVLTRPDLSINGASAPVIARDKVSLQRLWRGRAIFFRTNGAKVGMGYEREVTTDQ